MTNEADIAAALRRMQGLPIDHQIARLHREFPEITSEEIRHAFGARSKADEFQEVLRTFKAYEPDQRTPKARWHAACGAHPDWMYVGGGWHWIGKGEQPSEADMVGWFQSEHPAEARWIEDEIERG